LGEKGSSVMNGPTESIYQTEIGTDRSQKVKTRRGGVQQRLIGRDHG